MRFWGSEEGKDGDADCGSGRCVGVHVGFLIYQDIFEHCDVAML